MWVFFSRILDIQGLMKKLDLIYMQCLSISSDTVCASREGRSHLVVITYGQKSGPALGCCWLWGVIQLMSGESRSWPPLDSLVFPTCAGKESLFPFPHGLHCSYQVGCVVASLVDGVDWTWLSSRLPLSRWSRALTSLRCDWKSSFPCGPHSYLRERRMLCHSAVM